jgi:hypothetical protein
MEPIIIKLDFPILHGSEEITEVVIARRLQVADMKGTGNLSDLDRTIKLVERLTCQPPSVIDKMDSLDFKKVSDILESFLSPSQ